MIPFKAIESSPKTVPPKTAAPKTPAQATTSGEAAPAPAGPAPATAPPTLTAEVRRAAVLALEGTDGSAGRDPGIRPIRLASLLAALRVGGAAITADVAGPIASRGVDFPLTAANEAALREAGAPPELVRLIAASYAAPKPEPKSGPAPPRTGRTLADVRSMYVERAPEGMDRYIKDEMRKQLGSLVRLVESPEGADAIMRVTIEAQKGGAISGAARAIGIKDRPVVSPAILEPGSARELGQQRTGDRKPVIGVFRGDGRSVAAQRIVRELKDDLVNHQSY